MNEVEDAVRQSLAAHEMTDYDATDLLIRVRERIESSQQPSRSSRSIAVVTAAAAAVLALVATGWGLWSRDQPGNRSPSPASQTHAAPSTTTGQLPEEPPGAKFVGYRGVMLTLSGSWATAGTCDHRAHRILTFPSSGPVRNCPYFQRHAPAVVVAFHESIVGPAALLGKTVPGGQIGGEQVLLTDVLHRGDTYSQTLAVPAEQFYVAVLAHRRAVVNRIIESAQAVPAGYTAVPEVRGTARAAATRALRDAKLSPERDLPYESTDLGPVHVIGVHPATGTVVPVGTPVRLRFG